MNPAQFQNMAGGMPNAMQQQQMRTAPSLTPQQISRIIIQNLTGHTQSLQQQGKFVGWHSTVQIEQRAVQVKLLIDSLRLIQPVVAYDQAINVALTFEQKAFSQEPSRENYLATIKEKLSRIQDTRASQVQSQSNNLQQMMQPGQNMSFNPQLQQQMQPSPLMPQNMLQDQQNLNTGMVNQPGPGQQNMQQRASIQNRSNFSDEDNKNINQLAAAMAKRMTNEEMRRIRETLTDQQKQQMAMKNVDPLAFFFRAQATKEYSRQKLAAQVQHAQNGGSQMQQQMQPGQTAQNFGAWPAGSPLPGSLDRFQGQQADGMRSQEVGELVVPASIPQGMNPEQFQLHKQLLQNQQRQANGAPNSMLPQQQNQQNRQAQLQAQQARAQASQRAAQLSLTGQNNVQHPSQSSTPLSQLTRAGGSNAPGINHPPSGQQPHPGAPGKAGLQPQQAGQSAQNTLARFPPELQAILKQKPTSEWRSTAQAYMAQQQRVGMDRSLSNQPNSMLMPTAGQIQQLPNGPNGTYIQSPAMQQSLSSGAMPSQLQPPRSQPDAQQMLQQQQQHRQMQQNQDLVRQRQMQVNQIQQQQLQNQQQQAHIQQQLQAAQQQQPQSKPVGPPLNATQMAYMDQQEAHKTIAANLQEHEQWSPAIRTWGQLKEWLSRYPITTLPITRIEEVQKIQFANLMAMRHKQQQLQQQQQQQQQQQRQQQQQLAAMSINGMPAQQLQQHISRQNRLNMPQVNLGGQHNMIPQVKPVTVEEIANARRMNPQFQHFPDERIGSFIHSQRVKALQNRLNEQALRQDPGFIPVQPGQPQVQQLDSQMARQPSAPGVRSGPQQQMSQAAQGPLSARPQSQALPGTQIPPKTLKRFNEIENSQASQSTQQSNRPQQQQAPGSVPNLSREQFDKLAPAQQQRFMAIKRSEQRNREAGLAIIQLTKEVQSTMPQRKGIANMSAANKAKAIKLLTQEQTKNMLGRFDPFIVQFLSLSNDRETTKQLLALRLQLLPQYKNQSFVNKTYEVADQFSMTADQIDAAITEMFQKFQMTLQKSTQLRQQSQNIQAQAAPVPQQLTPGNLELLEQQEAQRRNSKTLKGKDVPPAPTTSQPPFNFGDARGQGTPKYASVGLKQEDLKLDPKRRKRNPTTSATPTAPNIPATGSASAPAIKVEQQGRKMEPEMPYKCPIANCEYKIKGFVTQPELERHVISDHRPTQEPTQEPVDDPIAFFIDNMHRGLGLDENGRPGPQKSNLVQPRSLPMQKTTSTAPAAIKVEAMSKPGTPLGHASSAGPTNVEADLWADAQVKPELLHDVFSGPDPFTTEFDLDQFVRVYKQSDDWATLPRANPKDGFCADWKEPAELKEAREKKREARLAKADVGVKSPADGADKDLLVDLKIDRLDLKSDRDWEEIENMNLEMDCDMEMGSPWEDVLSAEAAPSSTEKVITADELLKIPWDSLVNGEVGWSHGSAKDANDDVRSHASHESLDWDAMFADEDNIVPGTNGMQARRTIVKPKFAKV